MKKLFGMLALVAIFTVPTLAQGTPTFEAGAGYQYRSFDVPGGGPRLNMNGWQISADANINHWLGVTADFDGTYATFGGGDNTVYSYMVGPQIYPLGHHVITPYVNVLGSPIAAAVDATIQRTNLRGEAAVVWTSRCRSTSLFASRKLNMSEPVSSMREVKEFLSKTIIKLEPVC